MRSPAPLCGPGSLWGKGGKLSSDSRTPPHASSSNTRSPTSPLLADGCGGDGWKPPNTSRAGGLSLCWVSHTTVLPRRWSSLAKKKPKLREARHSHSHMDGRLGDTLGLSSAHLCHLQTSFPALGRPRALPGSTQLRVFRPLSPRGQGPKATGIQWDFPPPLLLGFLKGRGKSTHPRCSCLAPCGFFDFKELRVPRFLLLVKFLIQLQESDLFS